MSDRLSRSYIESVRRWVTMDHRDKPKHLAPDLALEGLEIARRLLRHIDSTEESHRAEVERIKADRDALRDELDDIRPKYVILPGPHSVTMSPTIGDGKTSMTKRRFVVVGNQSYGLYYGEIEASDEEIVRTKSVRMTNCRHIARWFGRTGGITSLAAHGPCGSKARDSRIGAPAPSVLLTGIVNVLDCTPEAVAAFAKIETHEG